MTRYRRLTLEPSATRAFRGRPVPVHTPVVTGELGEAIVAAYVARNAGPVTPLGGKCPFDLVTPTAVIEVKAGLVSNGVRAQVWRLTIGEPGPSETAWLTVAAPGEQRASNAAKQRAIHARKYAARDELAAHYGRPLAIQMVTVIIDPDRRLVDVFVFADLHDRIGWRSPLAQRGYRGSFTYAGSGV